MSTQLFILFTETVSCHLYSVRELDVGRSFKILIFVDKDTEQEVLSSGVSIPEFEKVSRS